MSAPAAKAQGTDCGDTDAVETALIADWVNGDREDDGFMKRRVGVFLAQHMKLHERFMKADGQRRTAQSICEERGVVIEQQRETISQLRRVIARMKDPAAHARKLRAEAEKLMADANAVERAAREVI